jgi:FkbM family methyltransferase
MREIKFRDVCFTVVDQNPLFWDGLTAGTWENSTFSAIDSHVDRETEFLDFGAWVGAVTLYAASKARRVVSFEADPIAAIKLRRNVALNPDLASRISIIERAVSPTPGPVMMGAKRMQGDSMSSALHVDSLVRWEVDAATPAAISETIPPDAPLFMKIDIEGGEYRLAAALWPLLRRPRVTVLIAFHPYFAAGGHPRWHKTVPMTRRVFQVFKGFKMYRVDRRPLRRDPVIERLSSLSAAYFEARHSWLFVKG